MPRSSMCASGIAGTFYWRECAGDHVTAAVEAMLALLEERPHREWGSPYVKADARSALRSRLRAAERGRLRGDGEWRPIKLDPDLYELRWTDLVVTERDPVSGALTRLVVQLRLYYAENAPERWFLGLHAHEKLLDGSSEDIARLQDDEIRTAAARFHAGAERRWDVPELGAKR